MWVKYFLLIAVGVERDALALASSISSPSPPPLIAPPGYYFPPGSMSAVNLTLCPAASFCPGGVSGVMLSCFPATACPVPGLDAQPPCYWKATALAGNGVAGYANGVGTQASLNFPLRIVLDGDGNFVFVDTSGHRIRRVTPSGVVTTLAGNGVVSYLDSSGTNAGFAHPMGIDMDSVGNFIIADNVNDRIRVMSPTGAVSTLAGGSTRAFADGSGALARFNGPFGVAVGRSGVIFVADGGNARIRSVTPLGLVTTFAGSGVEGWADGLGTTAKLSGPNGITVDSSDALYWPDYITHRIRKATPIGLVSTVAGGGAEGSTDGIGTLALFKFPRTVAIWGSNLLVADGANNLIRMITPARVVSTLLGSGAASSLSGWGTSSAFSLPHGIAVDRLGSVIVGEELSNNLRMVSCVPCPPSYSCSTGAPVVCPSSAMLCTGQLWSTGLSVSNGLDTQWKYSLGGNGSTVSMSSFSSTPAFSAPYYGTFSGSAWIGISVGLAGWYTFTTPFFSPVGFILNGTFAVDDVPGRAVLTPSGDFTVLDQTVSYTNLGTFSIATTSASSSLSFTVENKVLAAVGLCASFSSLTLYCPEGSFSSIVSTVPLQATCAACPMARFCPKHTVTPVNCPAGRYSNVLSAANLSSCLFCPLGKFSNAGDAACINVSLSPTTSSTPSSSPTVTPSGTRTSTSTLTPSNSPTHTHTVTPTVTPSPTPTLSTTITPTSPPTGSRTLTTTPFPTPTVSPSPTPSFTSTSSPTVTSSVSPTSTPTSSSSPSSTISLSTTPSSTGTPTVTPTASNTPPPFSCLSRTRDFPVPCKIPTTTLHPPHFLAMTADASTGLTSSPLYHSSNVTALFSNWPFISSILSVTFPISPSRGESVSVTCTPSDTTLAKVSAGSTLFYTPCTGFNKSGAFCITLPSAPESNSLGVITVNFTFSGATPAFNSSYLNHAISGGKLTCTVTSRPLATTPAAGLPLPQYGLSTTLSPVSTALAPFSLPLLSAVLLESSSSFGTFVVVGGGSRVATTESPSSASSFTLPPTYTFPCDSVATYATTASATLSSVWTTPLVALNCSATATALAAMVATISHQLPSSGRTHSPTPSLATVFGGSRHLLLAASPLTPFQQGSLRVFLGTTPCTLNWILPGGALASVTTPTLPSLCSSLNATSTTATTTLSRGDCGTFPLILLNSPPHLSIPSIYPPLQPTNDWVPVLTQGALDDPKSPLALASALVGLPLSSILATTELYTPQGTGIRIVAKCEDPTAAPPEACIIVNGGQPFLNSSSGGRQCVWGSGDVCLPCPNGALCPGGEVLLPLPGYWAPTRSSLPSELTTCPSPDPLLRCPGFQAISSPLGIFGCGVGFKGQACAACDAGYYRDSGTCTACPRSTSLLSSILVPILVFMGGLVGFGVVTLAAVYAALRTFGGGRGVRGSEELRLSDVAQAVAQLLLWAFLSAQGLASLFTQAQAVSPPYLIPLFKAASALQFKSIAADPSCYSSIPFLSFWLATLSVAIAGVGGLGGGLVCLMRRPYRGLATATLTLATLALTLGYGALSGIFSSAVICTFTAPMAVSDYVNARSDGGALRAALGPSAPSHADLKAASLNPTLASLSGLARVLKTSIPVSVLTSDPYQVCGEGAHALVRPTAVVMTLLYTAGFPALGLWLLWAVGRLKGCRRRCCPVQRRVALAAVEWGKQQQPKGGGKLLTLTQAARRPPVFALLGLLLDPTLHPPKAWTGFFEQWVLAVITGCVAVAAQSGLSILAYCAAQGGVVVVSALAIGVLSYEGKLYLPSYEWKRAIKCALYGVTAITAVFNGVLFALQGNPFFSGGGKGKEWLSLVPLLLGGLVTILLLVSWGRSLFLHPPLSPTTPSCRSGTARPHDLHTSHINPMFNQPPPDPILLTSPPPICTPPSGLWVRHKDEDGDEFWHHPASGVSAWEVPLGGSTECGWVWEEVALGEEEGWVNKLTEARTAARTGPLTPPALLHEEESSMTADLVESEMKNSGVTEDTPVATTEPPSPPSTPTDPDEPKEPKEPVLSLVRMFQIIRAAKLEKRGEKPNMPPTPLKEDDLARLFPGITQEEVQFYKK